MYDINTGLPLDKSYLECGLPPYLQKSLDDFKAGVEKVERGEEYWHWDCDYCDLQASINCAEVDQEITSEQAWYLREKYLNIAREEPL